MGPFRNSFNSADFDLLLIKPEPSGAVDFLYACNKDVVRRAAMEWVVRFVGPSVVLAVDSASVVDTHTKVGRSVVARNFNADSTLLFKGTVKKIEAVSIGKAGVT